MATYAVGDIQGCFQPLLQLLKQVGFDRRRDTLWLTGDLVNRGPDNLGTLRFVRDLGERAITVLGNHDLHLLAIYHGHSRTFHGDTLDDILNAPDVDELLHWLRHRPLLHHDPASGFTLVHAGLSPQWDLVTARACALEVEQRLRNDDHCHDFFTRMYGNQPDRWQPQLEGMERWRYTINCLTRIRYCDAEGRLDFSAKESPGQQPAHCLPWFQFPGRPHAQEKIIFGHWSTLPPLRDPYVYPLDSGCVWGERLTALRLEDGARFHIACPQAQSPGNY